jgi:hypothetical protein
MARKRAHYCKEYREWHCRVSPDILNPKHADGFTNAKT